MGKLDPDLKISVTLPAELSVKEVSHPPSAEDTSAVSAFADDGTQSAEAVGTEPTSDSDPSLAERGRSWMRGHLGPIAGTLAVTAVITGLTSQEVSNIVGTAIAVEAKGKPKLAKLPKLDPLDLPTVAEAKQDLKEVGFKKTPRIIPTRANGTYPIASPGEEFVTSSWARRVVRYVNKKGKTTQKVSYTPLKPSLRLPVSTQLYMRIREVPKHTVVGTQPSGSNPETPKAAIVSLPSLPEIMPQPQGPIGGNVSPTPEIPDTSPKRADELPGFRSSEVSPEIKSRFDPSIVRVLIRRKGDENWFDWCQGTKINDEVFFAGHCEPTIGAPAHGDMPVGPNGVEAYDYASASAYEFTSVDPNLPNDIRLRADMQTAQEEGLVMPTGNDVAVLKVQPVDNPTFNAWQQQAGNQGYRSYSQISSMPYKVPASTPTLGTQVYFNGASQYNGYRLLNSTVKEGITIGEWTDFSTWDIPQPRNMYVVATNPSSEAEDGGDFGTSGQTATTNNGELLISESVRANDGYLNGPTNTADSPDFFQRVIAEYESRGILLGKDRGSSTVLFFTKVTNELMQKIAAAFGNAPPA